MSLALALSSTTVAKSEEATRLGLTFKNIVSKFTYFKDDATDVVDGGKERRPSPVYRNAAGGAKVIITDVADGCAASGLVMKGDKLLSINGTRVTDEVQGRTLAKAAVGEVVFSIQRGGGRVTATAYKLEAATRLGVTITDHEEAEEVLGAEVEAKVEAEVETEVEAKVEMGAKAEAAVEVEAEAGMEVTVEVEAEEAVEAVDAAVDAVVHAVVAAAAAEAMADSEEARLSAAAAKVEAEAAEEAARLAAEAAKARLSATMRSGRWWRKRS